MVTKKKARKQSKDAAKRLAKVAGIVGLYARQTAGGVKYQVKAQVDGQTRYKTLDVAEGASVGELIRAAEEARAALIHPVKSIEDYAADYATAKALRPHSIQALKQALRGFSLDDAKNAAAAAAIQTSDYAPATKRAYMQRVSAFFDWLRRTGVAVANPIEGRKVPKASEGEKREMTPDDARLLLADIDANGDDDDRLFVRLLRFTGARCSTIAAVDASTFSPAEDGGLYARLVNVKCGRPYKVQIHITDATTCEMIRTRRGRFWGTSENNLHMRLYKRMRRLFGGDVSPHSIRHLFACELLQKGVALDVISKLLDHSDLSITLKTYAKHAQTQLDDATALIRG